jgi:class 3 adenylate cyclase
MAYVTTLQRVELGVLGILQVRQYGLPVAIPGAKPRAILTILGLRGGSVVSADTLAELLWDEDPPRTADKALQTHISALRRALGDGFVVTQGAGWMVNADKIDATDYQVAAKRGRDAVSAGDVSQAVSHFDEALTLWRGVPELPDGPRGASEQTRWIENHAALVEDRADALLATGRAAEIIGELEAAIGEAPLRERRWGHLMLALYRAGRQGEALGAYQRARTLLADQLGVDPGPDLRRLEAAIVAQDDALELPVSQKLSVVTRAVTFLLTDIEGSTAAWESDAEAMGSALARHDEIVEQVVTSRGGRLVKTRGEGDATFSVFDRPSAASAAAIALQEAITCEPWSLAEPMRIRVALHTGEVELRDGDYFGRAVNRAARLRSLAVGGQTLCSGATAELVIDTLADDVVLADLGMRQLKNLARPEHVFELRLETTGDGSPVAAAPLERPDMPSVLAGPGPFVGRGRELAELLAAWQTTLSAGARAVLISGEPGVGKTRLAGEWSRKAYEQGAVVLYGRCDEDLGAPYQPFAEALRSLVPCMGTDRLRGLRGVEALLPLVPGLPDVLPDLPAPPRADTDTERYALFDAVVAVLTAVSADVPVVLILDDLHWAAKPTLLLLRHLLRFGDQTRVQIVGTYRSTDLDRSHPLAAMLADLHRDGSAFRLALGGLDAEDVTAYVAESGYNDAELARALASVTGGNPFFLIEALRHVAESGGRWDPSTLPQGVREAVSRRLSRLPTATNKALAAAAVVGSRFAVDLVEQVVGTDLVDAFDEACQAGIVIEEPGGRYRFNHAIVRQSLLAELASVRRMRLHQKIAAVLEASSGDAEESLAELAYHYFECAWAGNAAKAIDYCRRAADQAMARLAYEGAADLYDKALHALEELDDALPDRADLQAELLISRCEALLAAGDMVSATEAVAQLQRAAGDSGRLGAWGSCFDGELSMLTDPERLDEIAASVGAAAETLAGLQDAAGEAKAHTVRAYCLGRLGRVGACETALDQALTAARRAGEHRRVNAVLAGAPLAALWGPSPVPRAGGRCLDVVRLLRITTGSPVVEATSTRCQGVLDAFRGRAAAGRALIDSARRSLTELGIRHALLEVDQFAGIIELVADDAEAAEPLLRRAYDGFRRLGLEVDTAETAALLARACLALGRNAEADELCTESESLAGDALKAAIAWRTVRAQLLARAGAYDDARRMAEDAVDLAKRTDALVDHGDACLALTTVLQSAGDTAAARVAAEQAVELYERKGAAALAETARRMLAQPGAAPAPAATAAAISAPDSAAVQAIEKLIAARDRADWEEVEQLLAPEVVVESRRKIVGYPRATLTSRHWQREIKRSYDSGMVRMQSAFVAVRGERLALVRLRTGTEDETPGAPQVESLRLVGLDGEGRIALLMAFDIEDRDAAVAELDALHAHFGGESTRAQLANAASRLDARFNTLFAERRWDEAASLWAADVLVEDRRRELRREVNYDHAGGLAEVRAIADLGVQTMTSVVVAIRGERLALCRTRYSGRDQRPDAFHTELLRIAELDTDGRCVATIAFDLDDLDAAFAELDARYLAGEAAAHAHTWSVIARARTALARHELPPTTPDWVNIDHRRGIAFTPGGMTAYIRASWDLEQTSTYIEAVHRLNDLGAVFTQGVRGTTQEGFDAEWRIVELMTVEGDLISSAEFFDESDLDAAIARFDELSRPAARLENAASRVYERMQTCFTARDWDGTTAAMAADIYRDDRRRIVNAEECRGREAAVAEARVAADLGAKFTALTVIAIRGERLALIRSRVSNGDQRPEAFNTEFLCVIELDTDERIAAHILFDPEDVDTAIAELDARYLAGEAAPHAHTWSLIAQFYAVFNRHEFPAMTPDCVNVDHRRGISFSPGELTTYIRSTWDIAGGNNLYIEAVHRLSDLGMIVTHVLTGTSPEGFDAEWRGISLATFEGDKVNRREVFDETDLDAALARFDELSARAPHLENAATRREVPIAQAFNRRDLDGFLGGVTADARFDDRRKGLRDEGPIDADMTHNVLSVADEGWRLAIEPIAVRGRHLALSRYTFRDADQADWPIVVEALVLTEVNDDHLACRIVAFDPDDLNAAFAAFAELDARYVAGEARPYAHVVQGLIGAIAELNRHESGRFNKESTYVDRRRISFAPDFGRAVEELWTLVPDARYRVTAVHALDARGIVCSIVVDGFDANGDHLQWARIISFDSTDRRVDVFEEDDLDTALARFEELRPRPPGLQNAASRTGERYLAQFAARDWNAMAEVLAADHTSDDRRRVVNAGRLHGREAEIANYRVAVELGITNITADPIVTRGQRLVLDRVRFWGRDPAPEAFTAEVLVVMEINSGGEIAVTVLFDPDDLDAAFAELEVRFLAGEAASHARTWEVIAECYSRFNRRELPPTTPNCVSIDHRPLGRTIEADQLRASFRAQWDLTPDVRVRIESVHRLNDSGAVITHTASGTSQVGFGADWRLVYIVAVNDHQISRCEIFDEADVDAALARFGELNRPAPRLENTATRVFERQLACFAAHDWDAVAELLADDLTHDDRRPIVGVGIRQGGGSVLQDFQVATTLFGKLNVDTDVIATRGNHLHLRRSNYSGQDQEPSACQTDVLHVVEIDDDGRISAIITFEVDDIDAAFAELDTRYATGEAAAHAHTWSVIATAHAATNRHELPATAPELVDHRRLAVMKGGDLIAYLHAAWDFSPDGSVYIESVHRLDALGAVVTYVAHGTGQEGFEAEWRPVSVLVVDGEVIDRCEMFDDVDLDAALARFDELSSPATQLENAASRAFERQLACCAARDWDALAELLADDLTHDDRRPIVGVGIRRGRDAVLHDFRAADEFGTLDIDTGVIATRGNWLQLSRNSYSLRDQRPDAYQADILHVVEIDSDERVAAITTFGGEDLDAALAELDARYLAGEAAGYAQVWSAVAGSYQAIARHEFPELTPDFASLDHRRTAFFGPGDLTAYTRATWAELDFAMYIESVHRLSDAGAVVTCFATGTSQQGFAAEWHENIVSMVDGGQIDRCEIFDESDLDAALARFDELSPPTPRLANTASRIYERFNRCFANRDWDAMAELLTDDHCSDDRRRVVGSGIRRGRTAEIEDLQGAADKFERAETTTDVIATRGEHLLLCQSHFVGYDQHAVASEWELLGIVETDDSERIAAFVVFDADDLDAAFAELDARYLAGQASSHAQTWSVVTGIYTGFNRQELPAMTPDCVTIDHRSLGRTIDAGELQASIRAMWELTEDLHIHIEAAHRLSDLGAVVTHIARDTSRDGFDAEWRMIHLVLIDGDLISRYEIFDEADLDAAVRLFDSQHP